MQLKMKDFEEARYFIPVKRSRERNGHAGRAVDHHQMGYNGGLGFPDSGLLQLGCQNSYCLGNLLYKLKIFVNIFILALAMA